MVDSIGGAGSTANLQQTRATQATREDSRRSTNDVSSSNAPVDEVSISSEAASLAEIENLTSQARAQLGEDTSATLSSGQSFDTLL